jgi:hypothetical protein
MRAEKKFSRSCASVLAIDTVASFTSRLAVKANARHAAYGLSPGSTRTYLRAPLR